MTSASTFANNPFISVTQPYGQVVHTWQQSLLKCLTVQNCVHVVLQSACLEASSWLAHLWRLPGCPLGVPLCTPLAPPCTQLHCLSHSRYWPAVRLCEPCCPCLSISSQQSSKLSAELQVLLTDPPFNIGFTEQP